MLYVEPNYYSDFKCIASDCKHSCCVGWEIDIDTDSYERYMSMSGEIGERLRSGIAVENSQPHFVLCEGERCPMLNKNGLCDLITACGEDTLCDICADHPRFRNYFSDREEIGLGLCCEAAAELIVNYPEPFELIYTQVGEVYDDLNEDEAMLISCRDEALKLAMDKAKSFEARCETLLKHFRTALTDKSPAQWASFYRNLERLDPKWDEYLSFLSDCVCFKITTDNEKCAENLLCYFIYRYLPAALDDGDISSKIAFSVHACRIILTLSQKYSLIESSRMYSSEIEYSDENTNAVISYLSD